MVQGKWRYLYQAIDRDGALVDVMLSERRDLAAAKAFFRFARTVTGSCRTGSRATVAIHTHRRSERNWVPKCGTGPTPF
jgi:transposase-like protein